MTRPFPFAATALRLGLLALGLGLLGCDAGARPPSATRSSCLEQPGALPPPPQGQLPCDLLPPGFGAP